MLKYRPTIQNTYCNDRVYSRFIKQFIDPIDFCYSRSFINRTTKDTINLRLGSIVPGLSRADLVDRLKKISRMKLPIRLIHNHLHATSSANMVYYTSKPYPSHLHLPCFDIDPINKNTITTEQLNEVRDFLLSIFPNSFYDYGSSGKSLHFYLAIDTTTFWYKVCIDTPVDSSYSDIINGLLQSIIDCIKPHLESTFPFVKLDRIKGTIGDYSLKSNQYLTSIIKCGSLCKLPLPKSISDFHRLYSIPVFSFLDIVIYFLSVSQFSTFITDKMLSLLELESLFTTSYIKAHTLSSPLGQKDVWLHPSFVFPCSSILHNYIGAHSKDKDTDNSISIDNIRTYKDYSLENDAFKRSRDYGLEYYRKYYKENGLEPSFDDYREAYRNDAGTGVEKPDDLERLQSEYNYIKQGFDPTKLGHNSYWYEVGEYLQNITITDTDIESINKGRYSRPITNQDIDLAAGFYFISLTQSQKQKELFQRELTVAQNVMIGFFNKKKQAGLTDRGCNKHKVSVLRDILISIGWLVCVDDSYSSGFRSRRYILGPKHPRYTDFVKAVGQEVIDKWTVKGGVRYGL